MLSYTSSANGLKSKTNLLAYNGCKNPTIANPNKNYDYL